MDNGITLTRPTVELFASLLNQVTIPASAADFDDQCAKVSQARKELIAALGDKSSTNGAVERSAVVMDTST